MSFLLWPTFSSVPVNAFDILVELDQFDLHKPAGYDSIDPVSLKNCVSYGFCGTISLLLSLI